MEALQALVCCRTCLALLQLESPGHCPAIGQRAKRCSPGATIGFRGMLSPVLGAGRLRCKGSGMRKGRNHDSRPGRSPKFPQACHHVCLVCLSVANDVADGACCLLECCALADVSECPDLLSAGCWRVAKMPSCPQSFPSATPPVAPFARYCGAALSSTCCAHGRCSKAAELSGALFGDSIVTR